MAFTTEKVLFWQETDPETTWEAAVSRESRTILLLTYISSKQPQYHQLIWSQQLQLITQQV